MGRVQRRRNEAKKVNKVNIIVNTIEITIKNLTEKVTKIIAKSKTQNINIPKTTYQKEMKHRRQGDSLKKLLPVIILIIMVFVSSSVSYAAYNLFIKTNPRPQVTDTESKPKEATTKSISPKEGNQKDVLNPEPQNQTPSILSPQQNQPEPNQNQSPSETPSPTKQPSESPKNLILPAIPTSDYNKLSKQDIENFMVFLMQNGVNDRNDKTAYFIKWCQSGNYPQDIIDKWIKDGVLFRVQYY